MVAFLARVLFLAVPALFLGRTALFTYLSLADLALATAFAVVGAVKLRGTVDVAVVFFFLPNFLFVIVFVVILLICVVRSATAAAIGVVVVAARIILIFFRLSLFLSAIFVLVAVVVGNGSIDLFDDLVV